MKTAEYWIERLKLKHHPEGGFYRETYRSDGVISSSGLSQFGGSRNYCTAIYFLLRHQDKSVFHRIKSDEIWHFHDGDQLEIYVLDAAGLVTHRLGTDVDAGYQPQVIVPANHWFGAVSKGSYVLASCTVSPGFDFSDFEIAQQEILLKEFPDHHTIIKKLSKE